MVKVDDDIFSPFPAGLTTAPDATRRKGNIVAFARKIQMGAER